MTRRVKGWAEILTVGSAAAIAIAVLFATLGTAAGAASGDAELQAAETAMKPSSIPADTYEGMVTCSRCGARHSSEIAKNASDCARICVHGGANFALIEGDTVYILHGDLEDVKKLAGQRAKITGALTGNTIEVSSVTAGS